MVIVQRTKLCLDFSATAHIFHIILTFLYSGVTLSYIVAMIICTIIMTYFGEDLCMKVELLPINVEVGNKRRTSNGDDIEMQLLAA